jgi:hypothetical protein
MSRRLVYLAHPLGGDETREQNRRNGSLWFAWASSRPELQLVFAPWIILSGVWDETRRGEGLKIDFNTIEQCNELWLVGGRVSPGMQLEADHASQCRVVVHDLTRLGMLPPPDHAWTHFAQLSSYRNLSAKN